VRPVRPIGTAQARPSGLSRGEHRRGARSEPRRAARVPRGSGCRRRRRSRDRARHGARLICRAGACARHGADQHRVRAGPRPVATRRWHCHRPAGLARNILAHGKILGLVVFVGAIQLAETNLHLEPSLDLRGILAAYRGVLANRAFMAFALSAALIVGSLSAFFAGSPSLLIEQIGISPTEYGFYPPFAASGFLTVAPA